jgi:putative ABC transport system permease protein
LNAYTFHITPYDLAFLGTIFIGLTFTLQLWFTKRNNRAANRFLGLALATIVLQMAWVLCIDIRLSTYFPRWSWLPLQFSLALGPLIYFYVLKLTRPKYKFRWKDLPHFIPLLLQQGILVLQVKESIRTGAATYDTLIFRQTGPVLHLLAAISAITYLYWSHRLIERFYRGLKFNGGDRYRYELRWLHRLLAVFGLLWLLWIPFTAVDYLYYHNQLGIGAYYPLYLLLAVMIIWIAVVAFLRSEVSVQGREPLVSKPSPSGELRQKGIWLKKAMEVNLLYRDADLSLGSLAEMLGMHPHDLSRIVNVALKKNFSDFINEYRIREVTRKMQDPTYDRITLLGIAFDSGFNSKTTFNRAFREMTGKSPAEYKNDLKKERPFYFLEPKSLTSAIISYHEATPRWSDEKLNRNYMFSNYLKTAWRNLVRHKFFSAINVLGLALGVACSVLILLWVQNEMSIDGTQSPNLYRVYERQHYDHKVHATYDTPGPLSAELKRRFPEIQYATNMGFGELSTFQAGDKILRMNGNSAEADYFKMFNYPLLAGNAKTALNSPVSLAISRKMAEAFYGSAQAAIGKIIRYQNRKNFTITAVFDNLPANASTRFDFLTNWDTFLENNSWARDMGNTGPPTFVTLRSDANPVLTGKKMERLFDVMWNINRSTASYYVDLALQPFNEWYLHNDLSDGRPSGGRIEYVNLFSIIAVFILLIACINFMNLTTARSIKRAREIGVRKAIGAERGSLIKQFITESMLITAVAVCASLLIIVLLLPFFNQITGKQIVLPFAHPLFWLRLAVITVITGLISGSYPALYLSSFKPVNVLKGALKLDTGTTMFRKGLVVFQFVLAVLMITGTIIVSRQVSFIESKNLGYDKANLVYMMSEGELAPRYDVFKNELLGKPDIERVSKVSAPPTDMYGSTGAVNWIGKDTTKLDMFTQVGVGYDYIETMKLKLVAGREFSKEYPTDSANYILNETAAKITGYKNPIGMPFALFGHRGKIIGVVEDYHFHSLHTQIGPLVLKAGERIDPSSILIRFRPGQTTQALNVIQSVAKEINPAFPTTWYFVDDQYQQMYQDEQVIGKLSDAFSFLAIFISCLGLLGLAMFTAEQRVKEIGIRKVLGANLASLFTLLSAEFIWLVLIAFLIASPITWYAMNKWLANFAYHIPLNGWIFAASGVLIILVALATVSFQTLKAAVANPVKSLRSE